MRDHPSWRDVVCIVAFAVRTAVQVAWERVGIRKTVTVGQIPPRIEAITPAWLTGALCASHPGAIVEAMHHGGGSSGTSVRRQLLLSFNDTGRAAGLPASVFVKSTPSVRTRMVNGVSLLSRAEAGFYRELRPLIELRAPRGFYSAADPRTFRSIHLLEDLVATSNASFCTPTTPISRAQAEDVVSTLATLHGTPALRPVLERPPAWLLSYQLWWEHVATTSALRRFHHKGFGDAADWIPAELRDRGDELWKAFLASVAAHDRLPRNVMHNDVHLGNWYIDGAGAMGLCDWQCVCIGNGSRDLAYALATILPVEDRRQWERDLVGLYVDRLGSVGGEVVRASDMWDRYAHQLPGALVNWTPTHTPPPLMPDMQPRELSRELIRRITTAIADHEVLQRLHR